MDNALLYAIWLSQIKNIGARTYKTLVDVLGSAQNVYTASQESLCTAVRPYQAKIVLENKDLSTAQAILNTMEEKQMHGVHYRTEAYPSALYVLPDPPAVLYYVGTLPPLLHCIAIVGTRSASIPGREHALALAQELAQAGFTIISGMARGIDGAAHWGALRANGHTIAVLGTGADVVYPVDNKALYAEIAQTGCIVSEYPPGMIPHRGNFVRRNRIISALANGVVMGEGGMQSGAMITMEDAQQQRKPMFVLHAPTQPVTETQRHLQRIGAYAISRAQEVIDVLAGQPHIQPLPDDDAPIQIDMQMLTEHQITIVNLLKTDQYFVDEIASITKIPITRVISLLTELELRGIIKQLPGSLYRLLT